VRIVRKCQRPDGTLVESTVTAMESATFDMHLKEPLATAKAIYERQDEVKAAVEWIFLANACLAVGRFHEVFLQVGTDPGKYAEWVDESALSQGLGRLREAIPMRLTKVQLERLRPTATNAFWRWMTFHRVSTQQQSAVSQNQFMRALGERWRSMSEEEKRPYQDEADAATAAQVVYRSERERAHHWNQLVMDSDGKFEQELSWKLDHPITGRDRKIDCIIGKADWVSLGTGPLFEFKFVNELSDEHRLQTLLYTALAAITNKSQAAGVLFNARNGHRLRVEITPDQAKLLVMQVIELTYPPV